MNRILKSEPNIPIPDSRKIAETRNRIIHGYDTVSDQIIWSIVVTHLPVLKLEIKDMLNE